MVEKSVRKLLSPPFVLASLVPLMCVGQAGYVGSEACAGCHAEIYSGYKKTPMALSSGATKGSRLEVFGKGRFLDKGARFRYEVTRNDGELSFGFRERAGQNTGRKLLPYFIGSGAAARSYLIEDSGYLFEAPVTFYSREQRWDLSPRYEAYEYPYLTRPALAGCLGCHASSLRQVAGTQNRFDTPPFGEDGISCERCHGPGAEHVAGRGKMVNPAKLEAARRDSICGQCHLSGEVRVRASGRDWDSFRPGALLSDSVRVFVRDGGSKGMMVSGHVEKLAESKCKQASGNALWCGSCHDSHSVPAVDEKLAWFKARCESCHQASNSCKAAKSMRAARNDDCVGCHMPKSGVTDAQHVVYTDHSIPRRPLGRVANKLGGALVGFGGMAVSDRDLGLAYAIAGESAKALPLLQAVVGGEASGDAEAVLYLAELYRGQGKIREAEPLYRRVMMLDAGQVAASTGLGSILMERGDYQGAIRLFEDALVKNAGLVMVRSNLGLAYWRIGDKAKAEAQLVRTMEISPGFTPAANLLRSLRK